MSIKLSSTSVKSGLKAHSWIGLFSAGLLYLIAVSGTLSVFFEEFDRWEQPNVSEYKTFSPVLMAPAIDEYVSRLEQAPNSIYIVLPTEGFPRTHITDGVDEWYLDEKGQFEDKPDVPWTMLVRELHAHLLLPHTIGMALVGLTGVLCLALIISGVIAHPSIFKDAFTWRVGKTQRVQNMDLHNRIGVWGLPFHFMIAITGAFMGFGAIFMAITSYVMFSGDPEDVVSAIYGEDPIMENQAKKVDYPRAFKTLKEHAPDVTPIYVVIHNAGQPNQLLEIAATSPGRLSYSEMYRFESNGDWVNQQGLVNGSIGGQVAYSTYRLHYGHFHSNWVKLLYGIMGIAFVYLIVSGIKIWLTRRKYQTWVNGLWNGWVMGTLIGFASSCWMSFMGINPQISFFAVLAAVVVGFIAGKNSISVKNAALVVLAICLLLIPTVHAAVYDFSISNFVQNAVYSVLILLGLFCAAVSYRRVAINS